MRTSVRYIGVGSVLVLAAAAACSSRDSSSPTTPQTPQAPSPTEEAGIPAEDAGATCPSSLSTTNVLDRPSHGSAIALTSDDSRAVVVNRDAGTVTIFSIDYPDGKAPAIARVAEIPVGGEPWQVAMHPNDDTVFVVLRRDQKLVRIDGVKSTPTKCGEAAIGSEPTSLALTPTGATVWTTSFVDGTIVGVDSSKMQVKATVDLNQTLASSGLLGSGVRARPALAHPRAMVITNNGDAVEKDESMIVTEYYAQTIAPLAPGGANANATRAGIVYKVPLATLSASMIQLPPLAKMGFVDTLGNDAGCFPNTVEAIEVQGVFAYALSTCVSPLGPLLPFPLGNPSCGSDADCPTGGAGTCVKTNGASSGTCSTNCASDADCGANGTCQGNHLCAPNVDNFRTVATPAVTVIDVGGGKILGSESLNRTFMTYYDRLGLPDESSRRLPLTVSDVAFVPGTLTAYLAAAGADAVFKVDYDATYKERTIDSVGSVAAPFIDLTPGAALESQMGRMPVGVVVTGAPHPSSGNRYFAFAAADVSRTLVAIDLDRQAIAGLETGKPVVAESTPEPTDPKAQAIALGKRFFQTGLGRWSLNGQGWASCNTCHTEGISDNVTWFAPRGPTQTSHLDGLYSSKDPSDQRIHMWSGSLDEPTDHEIAVRLVVGGVGALVKDTTMSPASELPLIQTGESDLNGSSMAQITDSAIDDWAKIVAFLQNIRSPRKPTNLDPVKVDAGRTLFMQANCNGCHGGDKWTISRVFYEPKADQSTNAALRATSWSEAATRSGIPANVLPTTNAKMQVMRSDIADPVAASAFDQLTCVLRNVGTFGVAEADVGVAELRFDMKSPAQGATATNPITGAAGYNPPSLLATSVGAPFFHAGQARTLEAALGDAFKTHHQALAPGFLAVDDPQRQEKLDALVQFLLSIDEDTDVAPIPPLGPSGGVLCNAP